MNYELDLTHFTCPIPLLMAKKALANLPQNSQLTLKLASQTSYQDVALLCEKEGYKILNPIQQTSLDYSLVIKKE
ncbi:sulfurtransferase TusA family protein [Pasteurella dagmatis]|uniref:UPF0033 domain-containing protein n=1 Tax=Pasteurella dagmatis ATCC 43325 TaxID=667128 RepID=C9PPU0_9PAST|nr:sulfurtransferase TusA family protein [Pasteurella dagmatis]EEX50391.1 hypothetical protein HMPREF0621_1014 [Pasteurella dagmatis ATCC 43325]SNV56464.1 selenium metabolism protein YedF [Pasteurella dagmatis]